MTFTSIPRENPDAAVRADAGILDAWKVVTESYWDLGDDVVESPAFNAVVDLHATTLAGAAVQLRARFLFMPCPRWMEVAAIGGIVPNFEEKLALEDLSDRTIWSVIRALETMEARR